MHHSHKSKAEQDIEASFALGQHQHEYVELHSRKMGDTEAEERLQRIVDTPKGSTTVKSLNVSENVLTRVPPHVLAFRHCVVIFAGSNTISTLTTSPHIFTMTWLQELHMPANQLTTLPQEIDRLQQLTTLDLENNKLTSLPKSMSRLTRLEHIMLFGNAGLPDSIAQSVRGEDSKQHTQKILQRIAEKFASAQAESVAALIPTIEQNNEKCTLM